MATAGGVPQRASRATTRHCLKAARTNVTQTQLAEMYQLRWTSPLLCRGYAEDAAAASIRSEATAKACAGSRPADAGGQAECAFNELELMKRAVAQRASRRQVAVSHVIGSGIGWGGFGAPLIQL